MSSKMEEDSESWRKETIPKVLTILCTNSATSLSQRDVYSLLLLSPNCYRALISLSSLWQALDLREVSRAGEKLISALSSDRYRGVKAIDLEFARDVEDHHLVLLASKAFEPLQGLEFLNLNGCHKVSDKGIKAIISVCPELRAFSIYWNNITDQSLYLIADNYQGLKILNITRCIKLTDVGLQQMLLKCHALESLNLYALSSFTDKAYEKISCLELLRFLDLCGAQNLSDQGVSCIAKCKDLVSLNLTWCVCVTDIGVIAIAQGCSSVEFLSLFGIVGVTDRCLEAVSKSCSETLTTLDVNGCTGIKRRSRDDLLQLFPYLMCFKVHS